ncbi:MAG: 50S ribosomal protein L18 [Candidatus Pacebacteria bacterium]|nr:50S ribosomal protein L18 [Candidatus Paceibacterota bacterium]
MAKLSKKEARIRRHRRLRQKISGTASRPRLSVCCTCKHLYVQFIDDETGRTLAAASTLDAEFRKDSKARANVEGAKRLGQTVAERAKTADIQQAVLDRGGFQYHGCVQAIAEAVREAGVKI